VRPVFLSALALLATALPAAADSFSPAQRDEIVRIVRDALKSDPGILRDALVALQADEAKRQDKVTGDVLGLVGPRLVDAADPVAGNPQGDVTIVEFYDTRCPYCRRMLPTVDELLKTDPKIRYVYKDWPILGPASQLESRALLAAQRQGGYFKLQEALMRASAPSTRDSIRAEADRLGLNGGQILADMDDPAIKSRLDGNLALAQQIGLQGTPAIIIGTKLIGGAVELAELRQAVAEVRQSKRD
jgi:protein-disulfide isomerase